MSFVKSAYSYATIFEILQASEPRGDSVRYLVVRLGRSMCEFSINKLKNKSFESKWAGTWSGHQADGGAPTQHNTKHFKFGEKADSQLGPKSHSAAAKINNTLTEAVQALII